MALIRRKKIDTALEKRILTGLLISEKFLREIYPALDFSYFQSPPIERIAKWAVEHYEYYEKPCLSHIQDIFNQKSEGLNPDTAELVEKILLEISEKYEREKDFNVDYILDQALTYFKKRELEITAGNIQILLEKEEIDKAENQIVEYKKVARVTSNWIDPSKEENIEEVFKDIDNTFLKFQGELGKIMGNLERDYFVAGAGAFKLGKTWFLQELAIVGLLSGYKVVFFSLEMHKTRMNERIYKRLVGAADRKRGTHEYPCFDCVQNQQGTCIREERTNNIQLVDAQGRIPPFNPTMRYRPCTWCRTNDIRNYEAAVWKEMIERPPFDFVEVNKVAKSTLRNFRIKVYPRFSANLSDIYRDLDLLEFSENFIPDIIIVDYADILAPEDARKSKIDQIDETWMSLAKMGGERKALIATVTQVTREALEKVSVKKGHTAGWIGKLAHVDKLFKISQSPVDKRLGFVRVGMMVDRHEDYDENLHCWVLQKLKFGQVHLDSQIVVEGPNE